MTMVISLLNQKGGVGKTTIATNLAHGLHLRGYKTLLVDADPQGSVMDWNVSNNSSLLPVMTLDRITIAEDVSKFKEAYDIVIIDGASRIEKLVAAIIRASDIVLIPVQPSPYDVWATSDLVEMIKARQQLLGSPKAAFIPSILTKNTLLSRDIRKDLLEYGFNVFDSYTTKLVKYPTAAMNGCTVYGEFLQKNDGNYEFIKMVTNASVEFDGIVEEVIERFLGRVVVNVA